GWAAGDTAFYRMDLNTGKVVQRFGGGGQVRSIGVARVGHVLASTDRDGTIFLWDLGTGKSMPRLRVPFHGEIVACSPSANVVAGAISAGIHLWDAVSGKELFDRRSHDFEVTQLAFSARDRDLITLSDRDRVLRRWDGTTGRSRGKPVGLKAIEWSICLSP